MLNIADLRSAYGESEILHGLSLDVPKGQIVAVMGRNGMGKTTLMKTLMGIVPTKSGAVQVDGADVTTLKPHQRVAAGIAYVPQGRMIFSAMTVEENVETGLTVTGEKTVPADIYELFPVLLEMKSRRGGNLSGSSNSLRLRGRWPRIPRRCCLMNRPRASSPRSFAKWPERCGVSVTNVA